MSTISTFLISNLFATQEIHFPLYITGIQKDGIAFVAVIDDALDKSLPNIAPNLVCKMKISSFDSSKTSPISQTQTECTISSSYRCRQFMRNGKFKFREMI